MKKIILLFIFFIAAQSFAQTNGISYQAIILNPKGEQLPGINNVSSPLVNKDICMVFKFVDEFSNLEYQETVQIKTDSFGMVNLVIGKGTQTAGYATSFQSILWNSSKKSLVVGINTSGNCTTYMEISNQDFTYAPLAFSAINAENVTGIVAIENGGTNAVTVIGAKTNLKLENVNNTADANKPISVATQSALNLKVDKVAGKSLSTEDYSTAEKTKLGAIIGTNTGDETASSIKTKLGVITLTGTNTGDQDLSGFVTTGALANKVDMVTGKGLSTEDYSTAEKTKLGTITGTNTGDETASSIKTKLGVTTLTGANTGDQDLSSYATNSNLDSKVDRVVGKGLSTEDFSTADKAKLGTITGTNTGDETESSIKIKLGITTLTGANTGDQDLSGLATTGSLANKVDKVTGKGLSTEDYSTAEKTKLGTITGTNTGDETSSSIKTKLGVITLTGTNTGDQDLSSYATNSNLDSKVDKVAGKGLSTEDFSTAEKAKLGAILGTNTGDQDLSSYVINTDLELKANLVSPAFSGAPILPSGTVGVTQAVGDNTTALATTAFVTAATAAAGSGVDLTTAQTISGVKTFSSDVIIDGITVGSGAGTVANTAVGYQALLSNTSGDANTAIGNSALRSNTGGVRNTATGIDAMRNNTSGGENTASGYFSLKANNNGSKNTATGYESLNSNTSGGRNTGIGVQALRSNSTGSSNTATGNTALDSNTGSQNTASGDGVLFDNTSGSNNTALGFNTGRGVTTGSGNTILGAQVGTNGNTALPAALTNNIILSDGTGAIKAQNDGTNWTMQGTVTAPTFIGALTGTATTATNVSGTVAIANGGTGASTATSAFNALSPMTTAGDIIYGGASGVGTRLAKGLDGQVLTLTSGQPIWAAAAGGIPYTGATQAVNLGAYNLTVNGLTVGLGNGTGGGNTALGNQALNANTASGENTAIGTQALSKNTTGLSNTATGNGALSNHTTGSRNTSFGNNSGLGITTGDNNTAIGASANVTGASTNATAIGYAAIATTSNTIQLGNTSVTNVKTSGTLTAGTVTYPNAHNSTAGQVLTTNAAGLASWTTPAGGGVDLTTNQTIGGVKTFSSDMLVNGITVGRGLGSVAGNTSVGELSLKTNTTGYYNSAFGFNTLMRNTTGAINTAIGGQSLYNNTTGSANTGIGVKALNDNTTGGGNTAVGYLSLYTNISGNDNTVVGASALNQNTIGKLNAALGVNALYRNISGDNNIAIGSNAMTEGTTNLNNTAVGTEALKNQNASRNTALGYQAGLSIFTGDNNTVIGASTNVTGGSANATAIGYGAIATSSNTIQLGNTSVTDIKTSGSITAKSIISSGKTVMGTITINYSQLNNYDVSNVSILFVKPNSTWTDIYGLSGGVLGQVIHLYSVNDQTSNCCTGLTLYNFDSSSNTGTQKFVAPGGINIDSNKNTTLVFDGTYWRVSKFGM